MPSSTHEALVELFAQRPSLAAELLAEALGVDLPPYREARLASADFADLAPAQYRADAVVVLADESSPVQAVVVEVQLRPDEDKRWTWPAYLVNLRARLRCPAALLVLCPAPAVAAWSAEPIVVGHPGWTLTPLVLGPDRVLVVTAGDRARAAPELAVLSALAHGADGQREEVLSALLDGLAAVDSDHAVLYLDIVLAALPQAAKRRLEALVSIAGYEYQSDYARTYFGQGKAEGRAEGRMEAKAMAVLTVLCARGLDVPDEARRRVAECRDADQLDLWLQRAVHAATVDELFTA